MHCLKSTYINVLFDSDGHLEVNFRWYSLEKKTIFQQLLFFMNSKQELGKSLYLRLSYKRSVFGSLRELTSA